MFKRFINISKLILPGKVLIIYGARQVGKTTLIKQFLSETKFKYRFDTGDDFSITEELSKCTVSSTDNHVGNYELIVLDEAQKIPNIGNALKLMVDRYPNRYFLVTGSSSFELANRTGESLTGRKRVVTMYPISDLELSEILAPSEIYTKLEEHLIYGKYPEVLNNVLKLDKQEIISSITNSYLITDILEFDRVKNSIFILRLLKLLAFQIGSEVSVHEIANQLNIDSKTVLHYIDLLEKSFVIFAIYGYSKNLRKEVTKMCKYYFYDLGVRNSLISSFAGIDNRDDIGKLWENYVVAERKKRNDYLKDSKNMYFWRTYDGQEIDLVEETIDSLCAYEFKWQVKKLKAPAAWAKNYPEAKLVQINRDNYLDFVT